MYLFVSLYSSSCCFLLIVGSLLYLSRADIRIENSWQNLLVLHKNPFLFLSLGPTIQIADVSLKRYLSRLININSSLTGLAFVWIAAILRTKCWFSRKIAIFRWFSWYALLRRWETLSLDFVITESSPDCGFVPVVFARRCLISWSFCWCLP